MPGLTERRLRTWLARHSYNCPRRVEQMVAILEHPALKIADHLQAAKVPVIQYLAGALILLKAEIAERERQITRDFDRLPEADWVRTLPGAGENLRPALLACMGRDRQRFQTPPDPGAPGVAFGEVPAGLLEVRPADTATVCRSVP